MAGVFGGNQIDLPEYAQRPKSNILQIADWCGDYVKGAFFHFISVVSLQYDRSKAFLMWSITGDESRSRTLMTSNRASSFMSPYFDR